MGTTSLQADSLLQPRKKRTSFSLPSFGRSSGGARQVLASSAEKAIRVQKAAAWQWYTHGVGEAVVPTKRPPLGHSPPPSSQAAPADDKSGIDDTSKGGHESKTNNSSVLQKTPLQAESPRAATSRFKAEAGFTRPTSFGTPSDAPSTPSLYDQVELSGLQTQMADFVQRRLQTKDLAVADLQKSKPRPIFTSVSTDHQQTKASPPVPAAINASDHQLTKLPPSSTHFVSTIPFRLRPFSTVHRLFRKVASRSILKSKKNSLNSSPSVYEPEVLPGEGRSDSTQHYYHHYVHHHYHHYHYDQNPEESATAIPRGRRHSESSGIYGPHTPSSLYWEAAESDEEEEGIVEESPIDAYLACRRRQSDSFAGPLPSKKAFFDEDEEMKGESAKVAVTAAVSGTVGIREVFPEKVSNRGKQRLCTAACSRGKDEFDEEFAVMKNRRRSSTENYPEKESLERQAEGGGKSGGGTYKLGGGAKPLVRRRHSESSQRPEAVQMGRKCTPSPAGRPYWPSPSAPYYI